MMPKETGIKYERGDRSKTMIEILNPMRTALRTKRAPTRSRKKAGTCRIRPPAEAAHARRRNAVPRMRKALALKATPFDPADYTPTGYSSGTTADRCRR
jgi:hypothetical protein